MMFHLPLTLSLPPGSPFLTLHCLSLPPLTSFPPPSSSPSPTRLAFAEKQRHAPRFYLVGLAAASQDVLRGCSVLAYLHVLVYREVEIGSSSLEAQRLAARPSSCCWLAAGPIALLP